MKNMLLCMTIALCSTPMLGSQNNPGYPQPLVPTYQVPPDDPLRFATNISVHALQFGAQQSQQLNATQVVLARTLYEQNQQSLAIIQELKIENTELKANKNKNKTWNKIKWMATGSAITATIFTLYLWKVGRVEFQNPLIEKMIFKKSN